MKISQQTLNNILDHGADLDREVRALKTMLRRLQFTPENQNRCPVCGECDRHSTVCILAALICTESAKMFSCHNGDTAIDEMERAEDYL